MTPAFPKSNKLVLCLSIAALGACSAAPSGPTDMSAEVAAVWTEVERARSLDSAGQTSDAQSAYDQVLALYGAGEFSWSEDPEQAGWTVQPGENISDIEDRRQALPFAAEARLYLAERSAVEVEDAEFHPDSQDLATVESALEERRLQTQLAHRELAEVVYLGSEYWSTAAGVRLGLLYRRLHDNLLLLLSTNPVSCSSDDVACDERRRDFQDLIVNAAYGNFSRSIRSFEQAISIGTGVDGTESLLEEAQLNLDYFGVE